jgi:hypothetical protein
MPVRIASRRVLVTLGAMGGFIGTAFAASRALGRGSLLEAALAEPFSLFLGLTAGALVGFALWTLLHPRCISRPAIVLVAVNCGSWLLFLIFTPRLSDGGNSIRRQRAERDADEARGWPNGLTLVSHPPSLLAGRPVGSVDVGLAQTPLELMAGPAVTFVEMQAVPKRYRQTGPTVVESYWIASIGFLVSTAWWLTIPVLWSWRLTVRSRRREQPPNSGCT